MTLGCSSCGKQHTHLRAARRAAAKSAQKMRMGSVSAKPYQLGDEDDSAPRRVRAMQPVGPLRAGQSAWVQGSDVDRHIEDGSLMDLTHRTTRRRLWRVGAYTYSSYDQARRVAAELGIDPVEVA